MMYILLAIYIIIPILAFSKFALFILTEPTLIYTPGWWGIFLIVIIWTFIFVTLLRDVKINIKYNKGKNKRRRLSKKGIDKTKLDNAENRELYLKVKKHYNSTFKKYQDELRKEAILKWAIIIVITTVSICMMVIPIKSGASLGVTFWLMIFALLGIRLIFWMISVPAYPKKRYATIYKNEIIKKMVEYINPLWEYEKFKDNMMYAYFDSNLDNSKQNRKVEVDDYIHCKTNDGLEIEVCDISAKYSTNISSEINYDTTFFKGLFVDVKLDRYIDKPIRMYSTYIEISDRDDVYESSIINTDSGEFNECFTTYASEQIEAFRVLTSDVIDVILTFYKETNIGIDISIKNNHIYMKLHTGPMFEPKFWTDAVNLYDISVYNSSIKFILELSKELNKTLKSIDE